MKYRVINSIVSIIVGSLITLLVCYLYYGPRVNDLVNYHIDTSELDKAILATNAVKVLRSNNEKDYRDFVNYVIDRGIIDSRRNVIVLDKLIGVDPKAREYNDLSNSLYRSANNLRNAK